MILPYAKIDAFFWDELGCNYVDKNGEIIYLYDELDEVTEKVIKENTIFISLNLKQDREKFVRKYLEKRQRLNTLIQSLESFFPINSYYLHGNIVYFIAPSNVMMLACEDLDHQMLKDLRQLMPYFDNEKDISHFVMQYREKLNEE